MKYLRYKNESEYEITTHFATITSRMHSRIHIGKRRKKAITNSRLILDKKQSQYIEEDVRLLPHRTASMAA